MIILVSSSVRLHRISEPLSRGFRADGVGVLGDHERGDPLGRDQADAVRDGFVDFPALGNMNLEAQLPVDVRRLGVRDHS